MPTGVGSLGQWRRNCCSSSLRGRERHPTAQGCPLLDGQEPETSDLEVPSKKDVVFAQLQGIRAGQSNQSIT